jgi:hypothetical protein
VQGLEAGGGGDRGNTLPRGESGAPNCRDAQFVGSHGTIYINTNDDGFVSWTIKMDDPDANAGIWIVDVYVNAVRVDRKVQNYNPHASINPVHVKPGDIVTIVAQHVDLNGLTYRSVPNGCKVP